MFKIGIVAPSAKVPRVELKLGVQRIRQEGFSVDVHEQCKKSYLFFAGTDEDRAHAFFEYAKSPQHSVIWCARGGYGAVRILPLLERMALRQGFPSKKLLIGYSDSTALMEFVRRNWGWATLHAPMPSMRKFSLLGKNDWHAMSQWIRGESVASPWGKNKLTFWTGRPKSSIQAPLVGGNLTLWSCLLATPFQGKPKNCILFFEDVDENLYRIDRMLQQLVHSGSLKGVKAIVLGNFLNCRDYAPLVLKTTPTSKTQKRVLQSPNSTELRPLRKVLKSQDTLRALFKELGDRLNIPVAFGLPVGHGPEVSPLPLGAEYRLSPQGNFELIRWDWLKNVDTVKDLG